MYAQRKIRTAEKITRQANELNAIRNKRELIPNDSVKEIRPI